MRFNAAVPLDQIEPPERSEKLHPYENEETETTNDDELPEWEAFRQSVGTEPNKPLEVAENGTGYELVDGDRRYRALTENEADTVACFILEDGEDLSESEREAEKTMRMITANEHRKESDKEQKARAVAKFCGPWLLPPGERITDERRMSQTAMADKVGVAQKTISVWQNPLRDKYPLRDALGGKASGNYPDADAVQVIDETIDYLERGGDEGSRVVPIGQSKFVANEISDMEGVGLNEIRNEAKKGAQEGWDENRLLTNLEKNYAHNETEKIEESDFEEGMLNGDDLEFEDDTVPEPVDDSTEEEEETETEELDLRTEMREFDLEVLVDDDMASSADELKTRNLQAVSFEDEAAQLFVAMKEKYDLSDSDLMKKFVEPIFVDTAVAHLEDDV
ncbi:ParB N-terminal domain-containing protein [Natrinema thermotolerans]|uniref:ParB N-terminal domain-containing protein n=1 Tax=Natrinema thermotolerans TaxID=121872 RepID=A0AAF0PA06_9EURY|nr:ParB N-terminal domain-containing protein [Natrinema thermotolerans]QCC60222.1 hypothetical protein DVR14_16930 [Natrinema thermotolerans]QCC61132.1 hypothetical protein DVR14_21050 [Natrinema thermotolerans]WMT07240.1 ParB N-terminal domain-containing protein [Natrinema thermotolerans]